MGICAGDVSVLEIKQKLDKNASITWIDPYEGLIVTTQKKIAVWKRGKYFVKVTVGKTTMNDSTYVIVYPKPQFNLRDTTLCKGQHLILDAKNPKMRYLWSTGETTQKIKIENSGKYWVKINNNGCVQSDSVNVKFLAGSVPGFNSEVSFCLSDENKILSIKATPNTKILWSTGAIYPSINVTKEGVYWVKTENKNCGEQIDSVRVKLKACDCEMIIPNSFTPNEDNRNDYFFPIIQCEYSFYSLTITDKWDNVVFFTNNVNAKWDGRFKGNLCPEETYIYRIETVEKGSDKKQPRTGKVSLFR
jgi:gliding motility-associated-like protein